MTGKKAKAPTVNDAIRTLRMADHRVLPTATTDIYEVDGQPMRANDMIALAEHPQRSVAPPKRPAPAAPDVVMHFAVPLDRIKENPWQPRHDYDPAAIQALALDIQERARSRPATRGLLQVPAGRIVDADGKPVTELSGVGGYPIRFYPDMPQLPYLLWKESGAYLQLAYGHSRWEAFRALDDGDEQFSMLPVDIVQWSDEEMATAAWSENSVRKDLNPWEEATAIQRMIGDFGWTQEVAAEHLNLNRTTLANKLRLLKLPDEAAELLRCGDLSERQAAALLPMVDLPPSAYKPSPNNDYFSPLRAIADATGKSSDQIRQHVVDVMRNNVVNLKDERFIDVVFDSSSVVSPVCRTCPWFRETKKGPECLDRPCFKRKFELWLDQQANELSAALGVQRTSSAFFSCLHGDDMALIPRIQAMECEHFCVVRGQSRYDQVTTADGVFMARVGCDTPSGNGSPCACLKLARAEAKAAAPVDHAAQAKAAKVRASNQLIERATVALAALLEAGNMEALRQLLIGSMPGPQADKHTDPTKVYRALAEGVIKSTLGYYPNLENTPSVQQDIEQRFARTGVPSPFVDVRAQTSEVTA